MNEPSKNSKKDRWFRDVLNYGVFRPDLFLFLIVVILAVALLPSLSTAKLKAQSAQCVLYCAQDQVFAEPLFQNFTRETGIKIRPVFDSEAVKTVGLANRLLAEKSHPQCDVFWSNEELRTRQLAARGVFRETNNWTAVGYRTRRIVINTNFVSLTTKHDPSPGPRPPSPHPMGRGKGEGIPFPTSLFELTNSNWRGRIALAYPLFGTTATHFLALRQQWGEARWSTWCRALAANKPFLVDGNSVVVKFVGRGEAWIGLTDSDDIAAGQREGLPIAALPLSEDMLLIPNTVAVVRNAPHPEAAQKLFDYLQRPEVLTQLISTNALEGLSMSEVKVPTLQPDWDSLVRDLEAGTRVMKEIFLR